MLVFSVSVLADVRNAVTAFGLEAIDLGENPVDTQTAYQLMDRLCGQVGNEMQGIVFGALNVDTGEFKTWGEYITTEGRNPNQEFLFATGRWHTFHGECMLRPQSTWWEHGYKSFGKWVANTSNRPQDKLSIINVQFAGFTTKTSMSSWFRKCQNRNVDPMVNLFRTMPGIPGELITIWDGLERKYEQNIPFGVYVSVSQGESGRGVATTSLRVVHAVQVFQVGGWFWCNDQGHGFGTTWRNLGPGWEHVYSGLAWVEASGLSQMFPTDRENVIGPSHLDPCVNLENREIVSVERGGTPLVVEYAISRSEL